MQPLNDYTIFGFMIFSIMLSAYIFDTKIFNFLNTNAINEGRRINNLDGVRFILASCVAFHHFCFNNNLFYKNSWELGPNMDLMYFLGKFSVAIFFIISGYLFLPQIDKDRNWFSFLLKRFFRIIPMCWVQSIFAIIALYFMSEKINIHYAGFFYWFDGAISNIRPNLFTINHFSTLNSSQSLISSGVTWSLQYEWLLYFSIPILYMINIKNNYKLVCILFAFLAILFISKYDYWQSSYIFLFCLGGIINGFIFKFPKKAIEIMFFIMILFFIVSYKYFIKGWDGPIYYISDLLYSIFCILLFSGASFFGFLTKKSVIMLGESSYSIYLLHGIGWSILNFILHDSNLNTITYLSISELFWILICIASLICYKYIEYPMILIGKKYSDTWTASYFNISKKDKSIQS